MIKSPVAGAIKLIPADITIFIFIQRIKADMGLAQVPGPLCCKLLLLLCAKGSFLGSNTAAGTKVSAAKRQK